jgi:flagellin
MVSSVHTNSSAVAAVQALRSTADALDSAHTLMSTGFRVSTAADNAAYWSIATTMKSDNLTQFAVHDGLGLAAAIVDTAYTGLTDTLSILDRIKSKIVSAHQPGVDRSKIQSELDQLIRHATDTARASSFGGTNWLYTTAPDNLLLTNPMRSEILSSVSREADMSLSIGVIGFNRTPISLLNDGGGGLLQKEPWALGTLGGFRDIHINTTSHNGHEDHRFTGPVTFGASDFVAFDLTVDASIYSAGETYNITVDRSLVDAALGTSDGLVSSADDLRSVLESYFTSFGIPATTNSYWAGATPTNVEIGSLETSGHVGSSIAVSNVTSSFPGNFAMGLEASPDLLDHDNMYPQGSLSFDGPFSVGPKATITFDVEVGTSGRRTIAIDQTAVNQALGTHGAEVKTAEELAQVIEFVAGSVGLHAAANGTTVEFAADRVVYPNAGNRAANVYIGNVQFNEGRVLDFDLEHIRLNPVHSRQRRSSWRIRPA